MGFAITCFWNGIVKNNNKKIFKKSTDESRDCLEWAGELGLDILGT